MSDLHTCSAECPCQSGGKPAPDFLPIEGAVPVLGWFGYLEYLAAAAAARASRETEQTK